MSSSMKIQYNKNTNTIRTHWGEVAEAGVDLFISLEELHTPRKGTLQVPADS